MNRENPRIIKHNETMPISNQKPIREQWPKYCDGQYMGSSWNSFFISDNLSFPHTKLRKALN